MREQAEYEQRQEEEGQWSHLESLMHPQCFESLDNFPIYELVTSSVTLQEIYLWVDAMVEKNICNQYQQEVIYANRVRTEVMRSIITSLARRPMRDVIDSFKMLKDIMKRECTAVKEVVKKCIDQLTEYWVKVSKRDAKERTVVQIVDGGSFACLKPEVLEKWFDQLKEIGLLSGKQHHELTNCGEPQNPD